MTSLSVNINKIAVLRNSRGANIPNLIAVAKDIEKFGADGITIHPRPDQRHIRYNDVIPLSKAVLTELNIEGNPTPAFTELVLTACPKQVTLVPDKEEAITSNAGWDVAKHCDFLTEKIALFKNKGIRTSIFIEPDPAMVVQAKKTGTDRIELFTKKFATQYPSNPQYAIKNYLAAAVKAEELSIGINAGHDLNLNNISFFSEHLPKLLEVSIGHALICESLYLGLKHVINQYKNKLKRA